MIRKTLYRDILLFILLLMPFRIMAQYDTLLYNLNNTMYDSIRNEAAFMEMCNRGFAIAVEKNDKHFIKSFRNSPRQFYLVNNRHDEYFDETDRLLDFYKQANDTGSIYGIWYGIYEAQANWGYIFLV